MCQVIEFVKCVVWSEDGDFEMVRSEQCRRELIAYFLSDDFVPRARNDMKEELIYWMLYHSKYLFEGNDISFNCGHKLMDEFAPVRDAAADIFSSAMLTRMFGARYHEQMWSEIDGTVPGMNEMVSNMLGITVNTFIAYRGISRNVLEEAMCQMNRGSIQRFKVPKFLKRDRIVAGFMRDMEMEYGTVYTFRR